MYEPQSLVSMHIKLYGSNTSYMLFVTIVLFTYAKCQKVPLYDIYIQLYPNSVHCSAICTQSQIKPKIVKSRFPDEEPWRHSSKYKALGQMLVTNQRLDKLAAACVDFANCGMLVNTCLAAELKALGKF